MGRGGSSGTWSTVPAPVLCLVAQSCLTICDHMDCSPDPHRLLCPWGFSRQEYWNGFPFSSPGDLPDPGIEPMTLGSPALQADSLSLCHLGRLLQGILPTRGSSPGLLHCRQNLYQLNHQESPRILEWVVYPFSRRSSRPRNGTGFSCIAGGFFTN